MSIERIFRCDAPGCDRELHTADAYPLQGLVTVTDTLGAGRATQHFCNWDCVLRHAARIPPVESLPITEV